MSRKMEERNLEQAITIACEPTMIQPRIVQPRMVQTGIVQPKLISAVASRTVKAKRTAVNKVERVERQSGLAERSTKAAGAGTATITKPKNANRSMSKTKSNVKTRLVKAKAAVLLDAPNEKTIAVAETIPGIEIERQVQVLSQSIGESAGEARAGVASSASREMCFEAEIVVPDQTIAEVDEKDDVSVFSNNELEVITDHVHLHQAAAEKRSATILRWLAGTWKWAQRLGSRHPRKRLRVCETVALGEKRFVAVIEVDGEQFLVGGGSTSVATLARLESTQQFSEVLKRRWAQEPVQA
jgi:hypothetical protein